MSMIAFARNPYLLVQESLAHGPVGADGGRSDGRVCVGVGHCDCGVGLLGEAERIVNRYSGCSRCWELVVSNASCILGTKPIPSALARAPYQKVEAASKDSRATILRSTSILDETLDSPWVEKIWRCWTWMLSMRGHQGVRCTLLFSDAWSLSNCRSTIHGASIAL